MTNKDKILSDLTQHLRDKILNNTSDYMDLCKTAKLSHRLAAAELMVVFSHLAASYAVYQFEIEEDEFIHVMRLQFQRAQKRDTL